MTAKRRLPLREVGLAVLVFAVVWAMALLYWGAHNRVPSGLDVGLWMLLLPVLPVLCFWVAFRVIAIRGKRTQPASAPAASAGGAALPGDRSFAWRLPVLAMDVLLPAGDSSEQLIEAVRAGKRAELHPGLADVRGLPVFGAGVDGIDVEAIRHGLPAGSQHWREGRMRALVLAERLATRVLGDHFEALAEETPSPAVHDRRPVLHLEWWLPTTWAPSDRETAASWLAARLGATGWPATSLRVEARDVAPGAGALQRIDELNRGWNEGGEGFPRLLLASDSTIDAESVAEWSAAHRLFAAGCLEGRIPGEGASALLLPAAGAASTLPRAFIGRLAAGRRATPVDEPQRLQSDTLQGVVRQVREGSRLRDGDIEGLVGDTDSRPSRTAEAMHLAVTVLPDADPVEALLPLGVANGDSGAALTLATLAVGVNLCTGSKGAVLVFSHGDPVLRLAVLVSAGNAASEDGTRAAGESAAGGS